MPAATLVPSGEIIGRPGFEENLTQRVLLWKRKPVTVLLIVPFHFRVGDHHAAPDFPIDDLEQRQLIPDGIRTDRVFVVDFFALLHQLLDRLFDLLVSHLNTPGFCLLELQPSFDHRGQGHRFCHLKSAGQFLPAIVLLEPLSLGRQLAPHFGQHDQVRVDDRCDAVFDFGRNRRRWCFETAEA
jgi:hypothetical protein